MEKKFKNALKFESGLTECIADLLKPKMLAFIEYCIATHDIELLNQLIALLDKNKC